MLFAVLRVRSYAVHFIAAPALAPEALEEILRTRQLLGGCCWDEGPVLQLSMAIIKMEQQPGILWRAKWISWPWWQQRFVPVACVTAMLPCSKESRYLLFTQICMSCLVWLPWGAAQLRGCSFHFALCWEKHTRDDQLLPLWLQSSVDKKNKSSMFQFGKALARHQENDASHKATPPLPFLCRFCVENVFLYLKVNLD